MVVINNFGCRMSKREPSSIKTESDLQKLLEDTRKLRKVMKPEYNPGPYLIINGMEVANYRSSGFPRFSDVKALLTQCIPKYRPIEIIVDTTLRYLIPTEEQEEYETCLKEGMTIKNVKIPLIEVSDNDALILTLFKHALESNAKILSNLVMVEAYEIIKLRKPKGFVTIKFQVYYKFEKDQVTLFE